MTKPDLDAIEARLKESDKFGFNGVSAIARIVEEDVPALLSLVREQESRIEAAEARVRALEDVADRAKAVRAVWQRECDKPTGRLHDRVAFYDLAYALAALSPTPSTGEEGR